MAPMIALLIVCCLNLLVAVFLLIEISGMHGRLSVIVQRMDRDQTRLADERIKL